MKTPHCLYTTVIYIDSTVLSTVLRDISLSSFRSHAELEHITGYFLCETSMPMVYALIPKFKAESQLRFEEL
jgi:hypothetical protein